MKGVGESKQMKPGEKSLQFFPTFEPACLSMQKNIRLAGSLQKLSFVSQVTQRLLALKQSEQLASVT